MMPRNCRSPCNRSSIDDHEVEELRSKLDSSYHRKYSRHRRTLQLDILRKLYANDGQLTLIERVTIPKSQNRSSGPVIVCLAGPMAVGKSYLVQWMRQRNYLPCNDAILVNMDIIREMLPESAGYKTERPEEFGDLTQKESGAIAELLVHLALRRGRNVIIDSSMLHIDWQKRYLCQLRYDYVDSKLLLLHVTAEAEVIRNRSRRRYEYSGRFVPEITLETSIDQLTEFQRFQEFCAIADLTLGIDNTELCRPVISFPRGLAWSMLPDMYQIFLFQFDKGGNKQASMDDSFYYDQERTSIIDDRSSFKHYTFPLKSKHIKMQDPINNTTTACFNYPILNDYGYSATTVDLSNVSTCSLNSLDSYSECQPAILADDAAKTWKSEKLLRRDAVNYDEWDTDDESAITIVKGFLKAINHDLRISRSFESCLVPSYQTDQTAEMFIDHSPLPDISTIGLVHFIPPVECYCRREKDPPPIPSNDVIHRCVLHHAPKHNRSNPCKLCRLDKIIRPSCSSIGGNKLL